MPLLLSGTETLVLKLTLFVAFVTIFIYSDKHKNILAYTKGLSIKLQGHYIDAVCAYSDNDSVKSVLRSSRSHSSG